MSVAGSRSPRPVAPSLDFPKWNWSENGTTTQSRTDSNLNGHHSIREESEASNLRAAGIPSQPSTSYTSSPYFKPAAFTAGAAAGLKRHSEKPLLTQKINPVPRSRFQASSASRVSKASTTTPAFNISTNVIPGLARPAVPEKIVPSKRKLDFVSSKHDTGSIKQNDANNQR